jgi:pyruvate carboxylase
MHLIYRCEARGEFHWAAVEMLFAASAQVVKGAPVIKGRPGATMEHIDFKKLKQDLVAKYGDHIKDVDVMSAALYPKVFDEYAQFNNKFGPVDKLDTRTFLVGPEIAQEIDVSK